MELKTHYILGRTHPIMNDYEIVTDLPSKELPDLLIVLRTCILPDTIPDWIHLHTVFFQTNSETRKQHWYLHFEISTQGTIPLSEIYKFVQGIDEKISENDILPNRHFHLGLNSLEYHYYIR